MLVSACLVGCRARYDAAIPGRLDERIQKWGEEGLILPFCPETAGGLPIPRSPAEIFGGTGKDVLTGDGKVLTCTGAEITQSFLTGARLALAAAQHFAIHTAVLKDGSPSCGTTRIYDGCFRGRQVPGQGVAAALLAAHDVALFNEQSLAQLEIHLLKGN
ncbi:MAG: DUF523 domain-containing protein [Desulfobacterales bacterium]|nr:DUF523 domain-containing protein [Desulfobacterales bacterium]